MAKKNASEIKTLYSGKRVVKEYNQRRFRGFGGKYIQANEVDSNLRLLISYLEPRSSKKILDVGAGRGRLSLSLSRNGYEVYCLDSSSEMVDILKKIFPKRNVYLQSAFEPIRTSIKFDAITALRFFDHFSVADQKKILSNVNKNLKKGGYIVFCALNKNSAEYLLSKVLYFGKVNFYFTYSQYKKMFESLGLNIVEFKSKFFIPRGVFLYLQDIPFVTTFLIRLDFWLNKLMPRQSALMIFLLRK